MRLQNFEISSSIELQSAGLFWDLHNFARFLGLAIIPTENICVSEILKVDPRVDHADPHIRAVWEMTDRFHLAICFQSRRMIELGSEAVELIPVSGDSFAEPRAQ